MIFEMVKEGINSPKLALPRNLMPIKKKKKKEHLCFNNSLCVKLVVKYVSENFFYAGLYIM